MDEPTQKPSPTKTPVRILFLEEPGKEVAFVENLETGGFDVSHLCVNTSVEFEAALSSERWDAIIADLDIPEFDEIDALRVLDAMGTDIPFILVSKRFIEEWVERGIKAGARDYVTRDRLVRLAAVLQRELDGGQFRAAYRKSQRDLVESEERFRSLTTLSSDWYWEQDADLRFTYVSAGLRDKYSEALESWAGKTRWELPYRNADWTAHRATVEARMPFHDVELQPFRHDGTTVYVSVSGEPRLDGRGRFIGYRGVGKDITERVLDAHALRQFRTAMDSTLDAITVVSRATMKFVEVNSTASTMLGYSRKELLLLGPADVSVVPHSLAERGYDAMITGSQKYGVIETQLRRANGSTIPVEIRQHAARAGADWNIVGVVRDHTERKASEKRLRRLNRLYAMASATNALVVRTQHRDELFRNASRIAVERGEFDKAWVGIVDPTDLRIVPVAWAGFDDDALAALKALFKTHGEVDGKTLAARAIREKAAVVSNNLLDDADLVLGHWYAAAGINSVAVLPIVLAGDAIAVFVLYTGQAEFFDAQGLDLLTELAENVAFALDHVQKRDQLNYLAYYDVVTGLANRSLFLDRMTQDLRSAAIARSRIALFLIDLERFKKINDSLGRAAGDDLLRLVAKWLIQHAGEPNVLARVDADRFALIIPEVLNEADAARRLERMLKVFMDHSFQIAGTVYRIAAKVGVALYPDDGEDADTLLKHSEAALKKSKAAGDRYLFYAQKMSDTVAGSLGLEYQLRQALDQEEFVLHYQPKVSIVTGKLTGAEALLRWNDPRSGLVPPRRFIPILEETGLIHEVGRWALGKAIEDYQQWRRALLPAVRISVNVSPLQLRNRNFVSDIEDAVANGADASQGLELELTESLLMEDVTRSIESLRAVRALGITVAIDDFGTGFSSLSYLSKLPVDTLKIDRSFVRDMHSSAEGLMLISVIINLAHALTLKVVAEGVETDAQLQTLKELQCDEIQGYWFGKPVPAAVFEEKYLKRVT